jgi:hypothetical protein
MATYLNQRLVTQFGKYQALKNLLDKWLDEQRAKLLKQLSNGARCPEAGPFLLELGFASEHVKWREEFEEHLFHEFRARRMDKKKARAEAVLALEKISAEPRAKSPRLYPKRNANYKRKYPIRLPA